MPGRESDNSTEKTQCLLAEYGTLRKEFAELLTKSDHKTRMDRMLYAEQRSKALRAAAALDENQKALAKAVIAVIKRDGKAGEALDALPAGLQDDPVVVRLSIFRQCVVSL